MAEAKTISIMKGELTISPDAFYTLVKLKEELEDVIETIEIMNETQQITHYRSRITDHGSRITDHEICHT